MTDSGTKAHVGVEEKISDGGVLELNPDEEEWDLEDHLLSAALSRRARMFSGSQG